MKVAYDPRANGWTPNQAMPEATHEHFCRLRSSGVNITQAASQAGVARKSAQDWSTGKSPLQLAIQDRVAYLRETGKQAIPSALELYHRMVKNAERAEQAEQHKTAHEAYRWLYEEQRDNRLTPLEARGETVSIRANGESDDPALLLREGDSE